MMIIIFLFLFAPPVTSFFPGILPVLVDVVPSVVVAKNNDITHISNILVILTKKFRGV